MDHLLSCSSLISDFFSTLRLHLSGDLFLSRSFTPDVERVGLNEKCFFSFLSQKKGKVFHERKKRVACFFYSSCFILNELLKCGQEWLWFLDKNLFSFPNKPKIGIGCTQATQMIRYKIKIRKNATKITWIVSIPFPKKILYGLHRINSWDDITPHPPSTKELSCHLQQ